MLASTDRLDAAHLADLGWELKPEGLCRAEQCVPLPPGTDTNDGCVDATLVAERLGRSLVRDDGAGLLSIGPESGGAVLGSTDLPDLELSDAHGNPFRLSALHGRQTLLVAWASW